MATTYTPAQIDKALESLPEELKEAIFSVETADNIGEIGDQYGVTDERLNKIAEYVGFVLMGLILPQEFAGMLEKDVKLPKVLAEAIARDLNRFVFYPVKPVLEQLHTMAMGTEKSAVAPEKTDGETTEQIEQKIPEKPRADDTYRESIE